MHHEGSNRGSRPPSPHRLPNVANLSRATDRRRVRRILSAALIGGIALALPLAAHAREEKSVNELKDKLDLIQQQLDASVARVERFRARENRLLFEVGQVELEMRELEAEKGLVEARAVEAARRLYMSDGSETLDVLLSADSFADLASQYETMAQIAELDGVALTDLKRVEDRLLDLQEDLTADTEELTRVRSRLEDESALLQDRFEEATAEYDKIKERLAAAASAAAAEAGGALVMSGGMACPIAAPNSFIDSWGFPRSGGRTHEGTDIMAASGAPVVAITDGRITFEGYGSSAGNWVILSGDDGNSYWYMHNRKNLVSDGRVRAGEQIATVGDTGNAVGGPPHVHFEYHPGGDGPVNPYPLLSKVCRGSP
jgi:murein DD-endopeptidase MepM/ murein hydrolase activator NlpD